MSNKGIAALVIGISLLCAGGFVGLILVAKSLGDRRAARMQAVRALEEQETENQLAAEREAGRADRIAAFAEPQAPTPEEVAEFAPLFAALGKALDRGDAAAVDRLCDVDRLMADVVRFGGGRSWPGGINEFRSAFRLQYSSWLGQSLLSDKTARWTKFDVRHVRWSPDRREAVLVTSHRDGENDARRWRWWVVRHGNSWKMYDNEDLVMGIRGGSLLAASTTPQMIAFTENNPGKYVEVVNTLVRVEAALTERKDLVEAERLIGTATGLPLPADYLGLIALYEARIQYTRGNLDEALGKLDDAERHAPGMLTVRLWRAVILNTAARYDEGLAAVRSYQDELGTDSNSDTIKAYSLEGLGRMPEALQTYRRALDEGPNEMPALHGLRRVLPDAEKPELADRLAKTRDPRKAYAELVSQARVEGDAVAQTALLDGLRKVRPDDPLALSDDVRRLVQAEKFADAAKALERGLKAPTRDDRDLVLNAYLFAMIGADKPVEAYAAVPAAHAAQAFRTIADDLEDDIDPEDDKPAGRLKRLGELVAAHRKRVPGDVWLWFYEGAILQNAKEYEKAEKAFAAGARKLPPRKVVPPDDPKERDWDADRFRARRVVCLFRLKKGLDAYRDVGPANDTFRQLAGLYDMEKDLDGLSALLAAHRDSGVRDPERTYWNAHLLFRKAEYTRAVTVYHKYLTESDDNAPSRWSARDGMVRSLLRSKPADAPRAIAEFGEDKVSVALQAAVAAANGEREELERLLADNTGNGVKSWFYSDEDFRRFIYQDRYRDLRVKYPDPNPPPKQDG